MFNVAGDDGDRVRLTQMAQSRYSRTKDQRVVVFLQNSGYENKSLIAKEPNWLFARLPSAPQLSQNVEALAFFRESSDRNQLAA